VADMGVSVSGSRVDVLFREHGADVLAYALRRADAMTAEDVVGEVFLIAWRRIDRVPQTEPVLWLYAVARRVLANQRRAARRRELLLRVLRPLVGGNEPAPEPGGSALAAALARLRPDDRELLMLTAWEGLEAAQAAAVLGCTPQAVHTRLHRARVRLRAELDDEIQEVSIA
jgi:DNA-directed RNA polymerase specialized sigma24 family protein